MKFFDIVDKYGNVFGITTREKVHSGLKILHPVVHLLVSDRQGNILLQLRSQSKKI